ncbi:MAG: carbamoyltransferase HypF, partial [Proteobacteria bacterium]|nr:carbamoyltransferase HypF [Pseudomonadota bacterium]
DEAIRRLRRLKLREEKPFAVMVKDIEQASRLAILNDEEKALLMYIERPIVLVVKGNKDIVAPSVAPGLKDLGIMLPYTPLHHLLTEDFQALVMTSANRTDEPICIRNREAVTRLSGIADYFLVHNRDILVRCDDSVTTVHAGRPRLVRRARGFAPKPVTLRGDYPEVLALGAHLKATLCIIKKNHAFLSPHIGDMETPLARDFFHENIALMKHITQCNPSVVACDLHPGYYSSMAAGTLGASEVIAVQHHHAHIVGCMAENGLSGDVIGLAMDGAGYGPDGQVWGGEVLVANEMDFRRAGHISYFLLPGGEKAIHEPWRIAAGLLRLSYGNDWQDVAKSLNIITDRQILGLTEKIMAGRINSPYTSSLGRLFDGVASIIGLRRKVRYEGQAAMELEALAIHAESPCLPYTIQKDKETLTFDFAPTIKAIVEGKLAGQSQEALASVFHITLVEAFAAMANTVRQESGLTRVVLSGGCFQNRFLLEGCVSSLEKAKFEVFIHQRIPTNDGGISLGQAVIAGSRIKSKRNNC